MSDCIGRFLLLTRNHNTHSSTHTHDLILVYLHQAYIGLTSWSTFRAALVKAHYNSSRHKNSVQSVLPKNFRTLRHVTAKKLASKTWTFQYSPEYPMKQVKPFYPSSILEALRKRSPQQTRTSQTRNQHSLTEFKPIPDKHDSSPEDFNHQKHQEGVRNGISFP